VNIEDNVNINVNMKIIKIELIPTKEGTPIVRYTCAKEDDGSMACVVSKESLTIIKKESGIVTN